METYAAVISVGAAALSCLCAIFTLLDRLSERTPEAMIKQGVIHIFNPRKKTIIIEEIHFLGAVYIKTGFDPVKGAYTDEEVRENYREFPKAIINPGNTTSIPLMARFAKDGEVCVYLKNLTTLLGWKYTACILLRQ